MADKGLIDRNYAGSRLRHEIKELHEMASRLNLKVQASGTVFKVVAFLPSIVYDNKELIGLYHGSIIDALKLASYKLNDSDLRLSSDPIMMYIELNISNERRITEPSIRIVAPDICHPHVMQGMLCYGAADAWRVDRTAGSLLPHVIRCLQMEPGSYLLSDSLNPSAAEYFSSQTKFALPLTPVRYNGR